MRLPTHKLLPALLPLSALVLALDAGAAAPRTAPAPPQRLELVRGKSVLKRFCTPAAQVTVGAPEIANVVVPNASEAVIVARSVGTTNLIVSGRDARSTVFDIVVGLDTSALRTQFDALFPQEKDIRIGSTGNTLVLSGMVSDAVVASQVVELATAFQDAAGGSAAAAGAGSPSPAGVGAAAAPAAGGGGSGKVLNMLSVAAPQQVLLEVKIAEVSKSLVDQLGSSFGATYGPGKSGWTYGIASALLSGSGNVLNVAKGAARTLQIDGEKEDGLVKILAEPTVMAVSGQEASFLAGGRIFIPVSQGGGVGGASSITLEEKEYGIAVKFLPTVLAGGRINLRVAPEVSELNRTGIGISTGGSATAVLPAFTTRRAATTVQLQDGESFAIGGLIRNNVTSDIKRFPFLGEVPILGALFRSSSFQNDRTELVFVVTPHLAKPLPAVPRLPTDNYNQPNRIDFLLGGQHEGDRPGAPAKEQK